MEIKRTNAQLLNDFIAGLNEMAGAAGVMIHHHQDLRWEFIRKILEEVKDATVKVAVNPLTAPQITRHEKKTQVVV